MAMRKPLFFIGTLFCLAFLVACRRGPASPSPAITPIKKIPEGGKTPLPPDIPHHQAHGHRMIGGCGSPAAAGLVLGRFLRPRRED